MQITTIIKSVRELNVIFLQLDLRIKIYYHLNPQIYLLYY